MHVYLAPMEGLTWYVYRNVQLDMFGSVDKYITPFIVPNQKRSFKTREKKEMDPKNNVGQNVAVQVLVNNPEYVVDTAKVLVPLGVREININLGCPFPTVVTKGKGSGVLKDLDKLDSLLEGVFEGLNREKLKIDISVKTRLGVESPEEFVKILEVYNRYPISELTIHPRVMKDYYGNTPNLDMFDYALSNSKAPVCYNGDIYTIGEYRRLAERFPGLETVMIGRGMIANPGLARQIHTGQVVTVEELATYHKRLFRAAREALDSERDTFFKMKDVWTYLAKSFADSGEYVKKIKKATTEPEYMSACDRLFSECSLRGDME